MEGRKRRDNSCCCKHAQLSLPMHTCGYSLPHPPSNLARGLGSAISSHSLVLGGPWPPTHFCVIRAQEMHKFCRTQNCSNMDVVHFSPVAFNCYSNFWLHSSTEEVKFHRNYVGWIKTRLQCSRMREISTVDMRA